MTLFLTILIIVLSLIAVGFGAAIVIGDKSSDEDPRKTLEKSGKYNVNVRPLREELSKVKPPVERVREFLEQEHGALGGERIEELTLQWANSLEETIRVVEEGYEQDVQTFRYVFTDADTKICTFLSQGNYITREQIYNHPELLPPFCIGCNVRLVSKEAWEQNETGGWLPITPVDGRYPLPDWRQIAK
jgi:hypothetical protein